MDNPCKRLRMEGKEEEEETSKAEEEADVWGNEECFTEHLEEMDALVMSQTCSQATAGTTTNNVVVERSWTSVVAGQFSTSVSTSVQQYEKQNEQMMNHHLGIKSTEEQLRSMRVSLAKNEQELEVSRVECVKLKQTVKTLEEERTSGKKQIEKLRKELDFMTHETSRRQWPSSQTCVVANVAVRERQSSPKKQSLSLKRKNDTLNAFESFTQRTNVAKSPTIITREEEEEEESINEKGDTKISCKLKKLSMESVETGPRLVSLLLRETSLDSFKSNTNPLAEWTKKPSTLGSREVEVESLAFTRSCFNESPKKSPLIVSNSNADLLSAMIEMLRDDVDGELESRLKWIPSDMPLLLTRLGLCKDNAHVILPAIDEILGVLPLLSPIGGTSNNNSNQTSSCPLTTHILPVDIDNIYSGTTVSSFLSLSSETRIHALMSLVTNALKLLRMIAYYSPKVRYCIITETLVVDAVDCDFQVRDVVNTEPTFEVMTALVLRERAEK